MVLKSLREKILPTDADQPEEEAMPVLSITKILEDIFLQPSDNASHSHTKSWPCFGGACLVSSPSNKNIPSCPMYNLRVMLKKLTSLQAQRSDRRAMEVLKKLVRQPCVTHTLCKFMATYPFRTVESGSFYSLTNNGKTLRQEWSTMLLNLMTTMKMFRA